MKLERMLSIITYLLNHKKVKAQELADKFEVTVRTIYRDIEAISMAGIPIATYQGADGGIGIVEGYKLDKNVFTSDEVKNILTGLKGLHSIHEDARIKLLIEKLSSLAAQPDYVTAGNDILIDLSSWNKNDRLAGRIRLLREAIKDRRVVEFVYFSNGAAVERKVEPCVIVFKDTNWYLYAFCQMRKDFRLFKLRRMDGLKTAGEHFEIREFSLDRVNWDEDYDPEKHVHIVLLFDRSMEYYVCDIFDTDNYETVEDGRLKVHMHAAVNGWLYGFLLGFGDKLEVLEPPELREIVKGMADNICRIYEAPPQDSD